MHWFWDPFSYTFVNCRDVFCQAKFKRIPAQAHALLEQVERPEKETSKNLCAKDFAELSVNFLVRFASKPLFYWVVPSNRLQNKLWCCSCGFFGFGVLF